MMRSPTNIPVAEVVIVIEPEPSETDHDRFFTFTFLFQCFSHIINLAAIPGGLLAPVYHLWSNYYPQVVFSEEDVIMPRTALTFIISTLLAFVEIKSQGQPGFPFETHPRAIMVAITSLPVYGLASAAELGVSASVLDQISVYAIIARLVWIGSFFVHLGYIVGMFVLLLILHVPYNNASMVFSVMASARC